MNLESVSSVRVQRDLSLLKMAKPLSRYAFSLQSDPNEAYFLVHEALHAAFQRDPDDGAFTETALRMDIERSFSSRRA
ncbi:hypothetical protein [Phenylobacterium sp.]|uniref:hypothetical protein n=1 Tax=Phenylobacterium sp. TaxID=1871053 RepID=UPI0035B4C58F